jgi:hypothetical protein
VRCRTPPGARRARAPGARHALPRPTRCTAGFAAPLAYALAGASPQLIVGPTAIMCILAGNVRARGAAGGRRVAAAVAVVAGGAAAAASCRAVAAPRAARPHH